MPMWKLRLKQSYIDYFLVTWMFCISGNPAFIFTEPLGKVIYGLSLVMILAIFGFKLKESTFKTCLFWTGLLVVIFSAHYLQFHYITVLGSLNYIAKMLCAILFAAYLGDRLPDKAIKVMTVICLISFPLFILNSLGLFFHSPIKIDLKLDTFVLYTQNKGNDTNDLFRNSGLFWEPGAFAGYIMATLMLFVDKLDILMSKYKFHFLILSAGLLTSMSTTGYIVYAVFVLYIVLSSGAKKVGKIAALASTALILFAFVGLFNRIDFLGEKIEKELDITSTLTEEDADPSRSGSMLFDSQYIITHPIFGNGLAQETRFRFHTDLLMQDKLNGLGNGFSGSIASMGLLFMIAYLLSIGLNRTLREKWILIIMVILLLQGEYFLNFPLFMMFPFIIYGPEAPHKLRKRIIRLVWNAKKTIE